MKSSCCANRKGLRGFHIGRIIELRQEDDYNTLVSQTVSGSKYKRIKNNKKSSNRGHICFRI